MFPQFPGASSDVPRMLAVRHDWCASGPPRFVGRVVGSVLGVRDGGWPSLGMITHAPIPIRLSKNRRGPDGPCSVSRANSEPDTNIPHVKP